MTKKHNSLASLTPDMTKGQKDAIERNFDAQTERHFKSHRPVPNGRNFRCWNHEYKPEEDRAYRQNFDSIFPNAPGVGL